MSGYASPLHGGYQAVHRVHLHKREAEAAAEADPQVLAAVAPAGVLPYVNDGPVSGPLTPAVGDLVATPKGFRSLALEGFSEDLDQDGFVDPIAPAAPVVTVAAPAPVAAPLVHAALPAPVAAPVAALNAVAAAAPVFNPFLPAAAPLAAPLAAPVAAPLAAPFINPLVAAAAVAHAPVVKSVVETPAVVDTAVHAAPLLHHVLPHVAHVAPVPVVARNPHVIKPFVQF